MAAARTTITITITGQGGKLAFSPNPATVAAGQLVVFKNNDVVAHHVMLDDGTTQTPDIPAGATSAAVAIGDQQVVSLHDPPGDGRRLQRHRSRAPAQLQPGLLLDGV